jgi:diguanylate cyclase
MHADLVGAIRRLPAAGREAGCALCLVQLEHVDELAIAIGAAGAERVLDAFEARLRDLVRHGDCLVPLGRHRAALVMTGLLHDHHVMLALAKLERLFEAPVDVGARPVRLAVRAGVAIARSPEEAACDSEGLLRSAQRALIASGELGRPVLAEELPPDTSAMDWSHLGRLGFGLEQDEFVPYFQPLICGRDESLVGAELLLRWSSPEFGLVMPGRFIPLAERAELIRPLTWFALKSGIAQAVQWPAPMSVSVNASAAALADNEIVRVVGDSLAVYGLDPTRLVVEVTESSIMERCTVVADVLGALRDLGVKVAIDDFGTGYSSFAQFRHLPADELKIDRSFVSNLRNPVDEQLVRTMVDLAHSLNLRVVAEGIEDRWTAERVKRFGCDRLQGYLFGRPMPAEQFLEYGHARDSAR